MYTSLHSLKRLVSNLSPPHRVRHVEFNFYPGLGGVLGTMVGECGREAIVVIV